MKNSSLQVVNVRLVKFKLNVCILGHFSLINGRYNNNNNKSH